MRAVFFFFFASFAVLNLFAVGGRFYCFAAFLRFLFAVCGGRAFVYFLRRLRWRFGRAFCAFCGVCVFRRAGVFHNSKSKPSGHSAPRKALPSSNLAVATAIE